MSVEDSQNLILPRIGKKILRLFHVDLSAAHFHVEHVTAVGSERMLGRGGSRNMDLRKGAQLEMSWSARSCFGVLRKYAVYEALKDKHNLSASLYDSLYTVHHDQEHAWSARAKKCLFTCSPRVVFPNLLEDTKDFIDHTMYQSCKDLISEE